MAHDDPPPPEDLARHRAAIDALDREVLAQLNERARHAQAIGTLNGAEAAYRPEREAQVLAALHARNAGPLPNAAITAVFREVMSACRALEQPLRVAYHPACTLQNSLKLNGVGEALLEAAGFIVTPFLESHLCCGSAGTYSILQPELSSQLRARKLGNIAAAEPDVLVSGNIGCLQHLAAGEGLSQPILHIAELLDWAESGVKPANLELPVKSH